MHGHIAHCSTYVHCLVSSSEMFSDAGTYVHCGATNATTATAYVVVSCIVYLCWVDNEVCLLTLLMQCLLQVRLSHIFKGHTHKDVSH